MDTSALVKYYHQEPGSSIVASIFKQKEHAIQISSLGMLEAQSAFAMKVRSGHIDRREGGLLRLRLMLDVASGSIQVLKLDPKHFQNAAGLIGRYADSVSLRTLDALQLAVSRVRTYSH